MATDLVKQLIDAGIHFGHRSSRWNPKMSPFIFGKRNLIHIIDVRETIKGLIRAKRFVTKVVADGKDVLFVGTKRQAKYTIEDTCRRIGMPFVCERWLGGTLTNFRTIRSRLSRLIELEELFSSDDLSAYSKKKISRDQRELDKVKRNLDGIRDMERLPGAIVVVDVKREHNAVKEAKTLKIPTVCLIDTDSDPDFADVPIPGNDDAIRAIDIIINQLAEAVELGKKGRTESEPDADGGPKRRSQRPTTARAADEAADKPTGEMDAAQEASMVSSESTSS